MVKTNISFIGMMGTSKTTCAKLLADKLDMIFLDVDELIEYEDMPICDIFEKFGEDCFREIERKKIRRVSKYENLVIATGGGAVKTEDSMIRLRKSSYIVLLTATSREILKRVKSQPGKRPLLKKMTLKEIEKIQKERKQLYLKYADIVVDTTDKKPSEIVDEVSDKLYTFIESEIENNKKVD